MGKKHVPAAPTLSGLDDFQKALGPALLAAAAHPEAQEYLHEREGNPRPLAPIVPEVADWVGTMIQGAVNNADKWKRNTVRPSADPIQAGIAAAGKHKQKTQEALNEGRYEKGLRAVDEASMLATIEATDPGVFSSGIQRRQAKITAKVTRLRPLVGALKQTLSAMPQDTDAAREAKMIAAKRGMQAIGKQLRG